ncbi:MAG: CheR family methyltransferase [Planctomycetaceae bacterium]
MPGELTAQQFQQFQEYIYTTCGIRIPDIKRVLLTNRLKRRLKALQLDTFDAYYSLVTSPAGQSEREGFLDAITTNETFFFRTEKHFEWFSTTFISELTHQAARGEREKTLRVWSAACSTGEEPYSLAICLTKNQLRLRDWTLEVIGTDISEQVLQAAKSGRYGERALREINDMQRRRSFRQTDDGKQWQIRPDIQQLVSFQFHNLMEPFRAAPFDCIFIRNVLIYFDRESKQKVIANLVRSMKDGAYLVVGPTEGIFDMLGMLKKHSEFLYQK